MSPPNSGSSEQGGSLSLKRLRLALRILSSVQLSDRAVLFIWAILAGVAGALCAKLLFAANDFLLLMATGQSGSHVEVFAHLPAWMRILVPGAGALLAGITLLFAQRYVREQVADYMEAIALGDGNIPVRASIVRTIAAVFCYSSGQSVGREGPLVQLATACASFFGRLRRMSPARRRLLVACGAASGLAAAYHTPLSAAIFVSEIVIGTMAIETLGPLLLASFASTLTITAIEGSYPLYTFSAKIPASPWNFALFPLLGIVVGLGSLVWLHSLRRSRQLFSLVPIPLWARMTLGGLLVGLLAVWNPESVSNGAHMIQGLLDEKYPLQILALLLLLRFLGTNTAFGSGAQGGVFTPSLLIGASLGCLFAQIVQVIHPEAPISPAAFALAGMAGFLSSAAQAPLTAMLMLFELTQRYDLLPYIAMTSVVAYFAARAIKQDSLYAETLHSGPRSVFDRPLREITVADIMRPTAVSLRLDSPFGDIAGAFLRDATPLLWVVGRDNRILGRVLLHEVEPFLREEALAKTVIAGDLMQEEAVRLSSKLKLPAALEVFTEHSAERLAVVDEEQRLLGSVSRSDLFLLLGELSRREQTRC